jgi:hypothetical protein
MTPPNHTQPQATIECDVLAQSFKRENKSKCTVETYMEAVDGLRWFLVEQGMPTDPTLLAREYVESFITYLLEQWKSSTAGNCFRALQRFNTYLEGAEYSLRWSCGQLAWTYLGEFPESNKKAKFDMILFRLIWKTRYVTVDRYCCRSPLQPQHSASAATRHVIGWGCCQMRSWAIFVTERSLCQCKRYVFRHQRTRALRTPQCRSCLT